MPEQDHVIVITLRDVWKSQEEQAKVLVKMDAKLDTVILNASSLKHTTDDHESRIRELEKFAWKAAGIGGLSGALLGAIAAAIINVAFSR